MNPRLLRSLVCCLLFFLPGFLSAAEMPLKKASLITLWLPQAQFAGYYMALEKGFYQRHGIDLRLINGGPEYSATACLRDGRADFAVLWLSTALRERDKGLPLVHIAQTVHHSSILLVARKASGILTLADLDGRRVGLWGEELNGSLRSLLDRHNLQLKPVRQSGTVNLFLRGGISATLAMSYNEYHTILNAGMNPEELSVFSFREHGFDFPEDGLYTLKETLARDPQLVSAFVRASLEGWDYAFAHPEETLDVVLRYRQRAQLPANRMHEKWMLTHLQDVMRSETKKGRLLRGSYYRVTAELQRTGLIGKALDYAEFVKVFDELP